MKRELNLEEKIEAIELWQNSGFHPLTCGECREILSGIKTEECTVVLKCKNGHIQEFIPRVIFDFYLNK